MSAKLDELAALDPENRSLKSMQTKFERIRQQVDKKLGKTAVETGSPQEPVKEAAVEEPAKTSASESNAGSSQDRYKLQMQEKALKKVVKDVDYEIGRAMECLVPESTAEAGAKEAEEYLSRAREHLSKIEVKYPELKADETLLAQRRRLIQHLQRWGTGRPGS